MLSAISGDASSAGCRRACSGRFTSWPRSQDLYQARHERMQGMAYRISLDWVQAWRVARMTPEP
jgi:hypothetical protein